MNTYVLLHFEHKNEIEYTVMIRLSTQVNPKKFNKRPYPIKPPPGGGRLFEHGSIC